MRSTLQKPWEKNPPQNEAEHTFGITISNIIIRGNYV